MKTPILDGEIKSLTGKTLSDFGLDMLTEYKAIKSIIENTPIVSTPDKPVWVVDEYGNKKILLADLGEKSIHRYILIDTNDEKKFLKGEEFDWDYYSRWSRLTPYTPKVTIEVTEDEAIKVEKFLKGLRDGK